MNRFEVVSVCVYCEATNHDWTKCLWLDTDVRIAEGKL